ncbi:FKBP-type peptidyl-prolyl cis-trans isomerase [Aureliella helgolandensis]|uniref:Peptidyl-prolyl cis-trans isomerase n=1 Tax=Aureliella helgolandensis TaxID=2527968 RepID=A0A518G652_9BACT|nr:FKBP-type peptidyl-prolyl cis-trans isomerase [Aureliella helgolandensis]QDV24068.1 FKBP-type 22 kDa peptidyl-prolyl cis-trans isomerase [Aureliella helgolandensis]
MRLVATAVMAIASLQTVAMAQPALQPLTPPGGAKAGANAASYGIGYEIGMNISSGGISAEDISKSDLMTGLLDALAGKEPAITSEEIRAAMEALGQKVLARKSAVAKKFLEENKSKDGVQETDTGLQYQVIKSGNGATPTTASTVSVHYEGKLVNGEVFDSSIARGEPTSFPVTRVIPGWTQALLRMKVGDKWRLFIPPELAYGENGSPPVIGPNEALVFEVELLEIK